MFEVLKKLPLPLLKFFCLSCLMFLVAVPASAQEQSPKSPPPPPPPAMEKPQPAPAPLPQEYKDMPERYQRSREDVLKKKQVTDKVGGQEIRAKQGEEDK